MSWFNLKDGLSQEWNYKPNFRLGPLLLLMLGLLVLAGYAGNRYYLKKNFTPHQKLSIELSEKYEVTRKFQSNRSGYAWGTFWNHCGAWITADHVDFAFGRVAPEFVKGDQWEPQGALDATLWTEDWACDYRKPMDNEKIYLLGFPQRSETPVFAKAKVLRNRGYSASQGYEIATWIIVLETGVEPVSTGMSGGLILDADKKPLGVLVTTGGDLDGDWTADFVALSDLKAAYNG